MSVDWADVRAQVAGAGAEVGDPAKIVRRTYVDQPKGPPILGAPQEFDCRILPKMVEARDRDGNITSRQIEAMIFPDAKTDPRNDDILRYAGRDYSLQSVGAQMKGETVLYWMATAKAGE